MTPYAERILAEIRAADAAGLPMPSVRELMESCGVSTTSVVAYSLRALARDGHLILGAQGHARSYRLRQTADEALLCRCLVWLETQGGAVGGALVEDLKARLCG